MTDEMQKLGKTNLDTAMNSLGAWTKSAQAIAAEVADHAKKSAEGYTAAWENLLASKTPEKALEIQSQYLKSSYEDFVARAAKIGGLYTDLANETYRPIQGAIPKASAGK
jgi:hypothetical protein